MSSDSQSSALLAHIVSQTRSNVDFLVSQNYLQASDAAGILSKLTSIDDSEGSSNPVLSIAERTRQLSIIDRNAGAGMPERAQSPPKAIMPARRNIPPPPPPPPARTQQARALWDYNENGADPNDLSFRAGDTIEIVSETNPDWWTGKLHGRQGLFPSNYVEKLDNARAPASPGRAPIPVPAPMGRAGSAGGYSGPPSGYASPPPFAGGAPFSPAPQWQNAPSSGPPLPAWQQAPQFGPPQPYGGYEKQPLYAPPPPPLQLQPPPPPPPAPAPEKKSRFGGLGATMANSAAGGVGFGAGAAIGSGIIDSIF